MPAKKRSSKAKDDQPNLKRKNIIKDHKIQDLMDMAAKLRIHSINMTEASKSGHPTTCSSIADIITVLFFDKSGMHYNPKDPKNLEGDRLVLSKGHAAPIYYAAWAECGNFDVSKLLTLRKIDSDIEGHPTPRLSFVDVATGSLGQGICNATGMAYAAKYFDKNNSRIFCICGDGEMAEGSCWEAIATASVYKLDNLIIIIDLNRLGQSQPTNTDHNVKMMKEKCEAFGAMTLVVDGHDITDIIFNLEKAKECKDKPIALVCKTFKGKGFGDIIENKEDWHGKPLGTDAQKALEGIKVTMKNQDIKMIPESLLSNSAPIPSFTPVTVGALTNKKGEKVATRNAYGKMLAQIGSNKMVVELDADTKNSTMTIDFKKAHPEKFIECFIAEQNMIGMAVGISTRGYCPFLATFAAFLTRGYDFIRMAAISQANIKIIGSHCGISIGQDGSSQMALEDLSMMRAVSGSVVLYPTDAVSCANAVVLAANHHGIVYIRTTRQPTITVYDPTEKFEIGKSKLHKMAGAKVTVVAAGVTFEEAKKASLQVAMNIVDVFSVKPIDAKLIYESAKETNGVIICVEDHFPEGGIFGAVSEAMADKKGIRIFSLAVNALPWSGQPEELLDMFGISAKKIVEKIKSI